MKVTQFQTAKAKNLETENGFYLRPYEMKPTGGKMSGVDVIEVSEIPNEKNFEGIGVAMTGSSCYNLNLMTSKERETFLKDIYSEDGLGLSVCRLSVGASDYSAELYTYDDVENDLDLEHFSVEQDDEYIIPMIKEALKVRPDMFVYASPWSPPGWMKTGGSICGGYMRDKYLDCYADYLIRYIEEYAKRGIKVSGLTPQNETESGQNGRMPACIWHPDTEPQFIIKLRKKLKEKGIDLRVWMHDHDFIHWPKVLWQFEEYPELKECCDGVAFHYYTGTPEDIDKLRDKYPDLEYHFTEGGPRLYDNYATDWCKWGLMISKALKHGCTTFTGWNLLLDEVGGPNIGPFFCGGLVTRNSITGELSYSGQYRTLGHFTKYIKKGAQIFNAETSCKGFGFYAFPNMPKPIDIMAAENPDGTFVLIITNPNTSKQQLQYQRDGQWWYIEALPNSVSTIVFEKD